MMNNDNISHAMEIARRIQHEGPIHSSVAGRTDHLPMHVKDGSYVIPADIISAMGEGNSMAGFEIAQKIFGEQGKSIYNKPPNKGKGVGIIAAGGEFVISPEKITELGKGSIDKGHKILDSFILKYRKKTIKTLSKLPGPK